MSTIQRRFSSGSSAKGPMHTTPALFTRMWTAPWCAMTASGSSAMQAASDTSTAWMLAFAPSASTSAWVSTSEASRRSTSAR